MNEQHPKHSTCMAELGSVSWVFTGSCTMIFDVTSSKIKNKIAAIHNSSRVNNIQALSAHEAQKDDFSWLS